MYCYTKLIDWSRKSEGSYLTRTDKEYRQNQNVHPIRCLWIGVSQNARVAGSRQSNGGMGG